MVKLVEEQSLNCMIERLNSHRCCIQFSAQTYFPLLGQDKFPLGVEYTFESRFPLVARIGLAARACGSGIGQSPSNSVLYCNNFNLSVTKANNWHSLILAKFLQKQTFLFCP